MLKGYIGSLGIFFIAFGAFVIVAAGNCVNLTDGSTASPSSPR